MQSPNFYTQIVGLKDLLENSDPQIEEKDLLATPKGPDLLIGSIPKLAKAEILASIPSRPVVDLLIAQYLGTLDMAASMSRLAVQQKYLKH
jgi:hypothetical protein